MTQTDYQNRANAYRPADLSEAIFALACSGMTGIA
jgi:hypothetical protein